MLANALVIIYMSVLQVRGLISLIPAIVPPVVCPPVLPMHIVVVRIFNIF